MFEIVHTLGKHYGWSKNQILEEIYPDEVHFYLKRIRKDEANDRLTQLAITQNPHVKDPKKLVTTFQKALAELEGKSYLHKDRMTKQDEMNLKNIARRMRENAKKRRSGG